MFYWFERNCNFNNTTTGRKLYGKFFFFFHFLSFATLSCQLQSCKSNFIKLIVISWFIKIRIVCRNLLQSSELPSLLLFKHSFLFSFSSFTLFLPSFFLSHSITNHYDKKISLLHYFSITDNDRHIDVYFLTKGHLIFPLLV